MKRVICYANLNSMNSPDNITDEHMQKFFVEALTRMPNRSGLEVVDIITDRYTPDVHYMSRDGWKKVLSTCKTDSIDFVVIPSVSMMAKGMIEIVRLFQYMRESYDCDVHLLYEGISSSDKDSDVHVQYFLMTEEYKEKLKKNERKLRGNFYDATQINREISAVPVLIDNKIYEKVEKFAGDFGVNTQTILNWFFEVLVKPENHELFEKIMGWEYDE